MDDGLLKSPQVVTIFPILIQLFFASSAPFLSNKIRHPQMTLHTSYSCNSTPCSLPRTFVVDVYNVLPFCTKYAPQSKPNSNKQVELEETTCVLTVELLKITNFSTQVNLSC